MTISERPHSIKLARIIFIGTVSALGGFVFGYDAVIVSGVLGLFKAQFELSAIQEGMFVNSALIGTALGTLFSGRICDIYGRKPILFLGAILIIVSVIGCVVGNTYPVIWLARFIGGMGTGMAAMICPLYIAEITPTHIRGRMVSLIQLSMTIGGVTATIVNVHVFDYSATLGHFTVDYLLFEADFLNRIFVDESWRAMFGTEMIFGLVFLILILFIPESPRWLLSKGRNKEARAVLYRLISKTDADRQMAEIEDLLKEEGSSRLADLFKPGFKKALYLAIFFCFISEISGITAVVYYGPNILENAGFSVGGALGSVIYLFLTNLFGCMLAIIFIDKLGRRPLLMAGTIGAIITLVASGILLTQNVQGFPIVVAICGYVFSYSFAMGPIKLVFASEVFPIRLRGLAVAISMSVIWFTGVFINQLFPVLRDNFSIALIFYFFAFFLIPQIYVVQRLMPETKGKSLEEIEKMLLLQNK